jgi:hypothetical protein
MAVSAPTTRPVLARTSSAASRIALLRHDRGAGGELVGELHQADQRRGPDHDLLGQPRQVHGCDGRGGQGLHDEVAIGHGVERIGRRPVETERLRRHVPVERERRAGQRGRAERRLIQTLARIGEAAAVARHHLDVSKQVMAEGHRLCRLQMCKSRHDGRGMRQRLFRECLLQDGEAGVDGVDGVAHPQPEVGGDLVVARARRVQASGSGADQMLQPALDVHVDVFERPLERELAGLDL